MAGTKAETGQLILSYAIAASTTGSETAPHNLVGLLRSAWKQLAPASVAQVLC